MNCTLLTQTVCQDCNGYLSIAPIMIIGNQYLCGRCARRCPNAPGDRDFSYESSVKDFIFPCRYDSFGCQETFKWNSALYHELDCDYQKIWCPAINCDERICKKNMLLHFGKYHLELMMTKAEIDTAHLEERVNRIYHSDNTVFILRIHFNGENIWINISCLKLSKYLCIFETIDNTNNNINSYKFPINLYNEKYDIMDKTMERELFRIIAIENNSTCSFYIVNSFVDKFIPDKNILTELGCPICFEYSKPNFPTCSNGHLICSRCFETYKKCPQCFVPMTITNTDRANKLAETLYYPCKYEQEGCVAFSYPSEIAKHESICPYPTNNQISCFFAHEMSCNWQGSLCDLPQHMKLNHLVRFLIGGRIIKTFLTNLTHKTFFMTFSDDWFEVNLHYEKKSGFQIRMWMKRRSLNNTRYEYYLEFDKSPKQCTSRFDIGKKKTDYNLVISSKNIKAYMRKEVFLFTIQIVKKIN